MSNREVLVVRWSITLVLLAFAWGVRTDLEGLAGGITGSVLTYWLPVASEAVSGGLRGSEGPPGPS